MDNVLSSISDMESSSTSNSDNTSIIQNNYSQVVFINNTGVNLYFELQYVTI